MTTEALPAGLRAEQVDDLIGKLRRIPDRHRSFERSELEAWRFYNVKRALLTYLAGHGLPHRRDTDGTVRFDDMDLRNVILHLSTGSAALATRRFWATTLLRDPALGPAHYTIRYRASCPDPGHPAPCRFQVALPGERAVVVDRTDDRSTHEALASVEVTIDNDWPAVPAAARGWLDEIKGLELVLLAHELRTDVDLIRRTGLADCAATAGLLLDEGLRRGLPVRPAFGLITAPMYSTGHHWVELEVDGRWVPLDPLLVGQLIRWDLLPGWEPYRSPGAILSRVGPTATPLVRHQGEAVRVTLVTEPRAA